MKAWVGYRWWLNTWWWPARLRYHLKETLPWKIALWLPRKVALMAFVRVYGVIGRCDPNYEEIYNEWESRS